MNLNLILLIIVSSFLACDNSKEYIVNYSENELKALDVNQPDIQWFKTYTGSQQESHAHYVMQTLDDGYLMIGETGFVEDLSAKILVIKIDLNGELLWKYEYGESGFNLGNSLVQINEDYYLISGSLDAKAALIKIDAKSGKALPGWPKIWDLGLESSFESIVLGKNNIIVAAGYKNGIGEGTFYNEGTGFVMFLTMDGEIIRSIDLSQYISTAYRIKMIDDGYMIASHPVLGTEDYDLIKLNFDGDFVFGKSYTEDLFWGFDINENGNMLLAGHTNQSPISNNWDLQSTALDFAGNEIWTEYTGQPRGYDSEYIHDEAWGVQAAADGSWFVIAGTGDEYNYEGKGHQYGDSGLWLVSLIKYSSEGELLWQGLYGDKNQQQDWAGEDLVLTNDGGILISVDNSNFGFLKLKYQ
ncbi:MAG: hypothetical protein HRU38_14860 [Saccharospirillaceae bacterium]|nr:hypothetical protein [Pseudomonadales bacterium]NRB79922.1 hypothetical protein [Saccharospirillaceae bacterium]